MIKLDFRNEFDNLPVMLTELFDQQVQLYFLKEMS